MAALLLLAYAAVCVVVFKLVKVPLNKWSITTVGLGGITLVGGLLLTMNYNHPFTTDGRIYFYTTPIIPTVQGHVIDVAVKPNIPLKQGDILFSIDPRPYEYIVDQKRALVAEAEQNVKQLKASLDQATAGVAKMQAQVDLAQQNYDRQAELLAKNVVAQAAVDTATRNLEAARQSLAQSEAAADRARLAFGSEIGGVNTAVARLKADLRNAEFDLSQTKVVAPTDGMVTQLFLQPGMTVNPSTSAMVFIHGNRNLLGASFPQNALQRIREGNEAEIAFDAIPGRVFKAKVTLVADVITQGQVRASGELLNPEERSKIRGRATTRLELVDDVSGYQLPEGSTAQVAIYTDHLTALAVIRRIMLRMKAWLNYVV